MLNPGIIYMAISVLLFAVAVVIHFHSAHLSLPISDVVTALTVILPIASFINAFVYPNLLKAIESPNIVQRAIPVALQGLQAIVTTVLATILAEGVVPSPALDCILERDWSRMFDSRDGLSIGYVQDTLNCCGFLDVADRAFPFPVNGTDSTCAELYARDLACKGPWRGAMQLHSGIALSVVLLVGVMQIFGLLMMRQGTSWWTTLRTTRWKELRNPESGRPLLSEVDDDAESQGQAYGSLSQADR